MRLVVVGLGVAACASGPQPEGTVIVPQALVGDLVLDGSALYWDDVSAGGIHDLVVDPLAAMTTTLVERTAVSSAAALDPTSVAVADGVVYWTNINRATRAGGAVWSVPASGGTPTALVAGLDAPLGVAVDGSDLYFIDDNVLLTASMQGGPAVEIANDVREFHVATGRGYWTSNSMPDELFELDLTTPQATPTMIAASTVAEAFAVDDTNLYVRSSVATDIVVTELPLAGGSARTLFHDFVDDGAFTPRIVQVGGEVYWNARTAILRVDVDGTGLDALVQNDTDIGSIAVGSDAVYFASERNVTTAGEQCSCPVIVKVSD